MFLNVYIYIYIYIIFSFRICIPQLLIHLGKMGIFWLLVIILTLHDSLSLACHLSCSVGRPSLTNVFIHSFIITGTQQVS